MKKTMIASLVMLLWVVIQNEVCGRTLFASSSTEFVQKEKVKIEQKDLPEAVRKMLDGDAYKGWTVVSAYKLNNGEYEVELKKGDTTQSLKFDKDGNKK